MTSRRGPAPRYSDVVRRWALLLVALAACRTDTAPRSSAPAQAPAATPVRTAEARPAVAGTTPSVAATTVVAAASDLPKFARPDADLEAEFPLRATIRTVGWTYETASGEGGVAGDGSSA